MYHLNTFHLDKDEGGSKWAGGVCIQKTIKKYHEINQIWIGGGGGLTHHIGGGVLPPFHLILVQNHKISLKLVLYFW